MDLNDLREERNESSVGKEVERGKDSRRERKSWERDRTV